MPGSFAFDVLPGSFAVFPQCLILMCVHWSNQERLGVLQGCMPTAHFYYDFIFIPKTIDGKKTFNRKMMESPSIKQGGKAAKR